MGSTQIGDPALRAGRHRLNQPIRHVSAVDDLKGESREDRDERAGREDPIEELVELGRSHNRVRHPALFDLLFRRHFRPVVEEEVIIHTDNRWIDQMLDACLRRRLGQKGRTAHVNRSRSGRVAGGVNDRAYAVEDFRGYFGVSEIQPTPFKA